MATEHLVKILAVERVTHNVKVFVCEKPEGYAFRPGQATEFSLDKAGWREVKRPFSFTSLPGAPTLAFTIKIYPKHNGLTRQLDAAAPGDRLILRDVWGVIEYKGPGCFLAGGAGITPFLAIFRHLHQERRLEGNTLFFSNKTRRDVILEEELSALLGDRALFLLTDDDDGRHPKGYLDEAFLRDHLAGFNQHFYLCGPPAMVESLQAALDRLGASAEAVVFER